jgi:RHS repeat-associated protein
MEITDMNEAEVVSYRYDPYGAVTITVGGTPQSSDLLGNPWTYTGRFHDEETGLYYYRARYYSPERGRFLERDPAGYAAMANLYEYANSLPTNETDPSGRESARDRYERAKQDYAEARKQLDDARKRVERDIKTAEDLASGRRGRPEDKEKNTQQAREDVADSKNDVEKAEKKVWQKYWDLVYATDELNRELRRAAEAAQAAGIPTLGGDISFPPEPPFPDPGGTNPDPEPVPPMLHVPEIGSPGFPRPG